MALQGTLDTFALPDVLRLLAATGKAGRLRVTGDRGSGSLWIDNGMVDAGEVNVRGVDTSDLVEMLYQLLRFDQGSFTFDGDATPDKKMVSIGVDQLIARAEVMFADWQELERVIPVAGSIVRLAAELTVDDVVIDAAAWKVIASVGAGSTVAEVAKTTGMGEIDVLRSMRNLIDRDLVTVTEPAAEMVPVTSDPGSMESGPVDLVRHDESPLDAEPTPTGQATAEPAPAVTNRFAPLVDTPTPEDQTAPPARAGFSGSWEAASDLAPTTPPPSAHGPRTQAFAPLDDLYVDDRAGARGSFGDSTMPGPSSTELSNGLASMPLSQEPASPNPGFSRLTTPPSPPVPSSPSIVSDSTDGDPSAIARQLASLSPRAAKAVAAAAKATTSEERDAALATIEAEDHNINRGMLLKFLGTVDG